MGIRNKVAAVATGVVLALAVTPAVAVEASVPAIAASVPAIAAPAAAPAIAPASYLWPKAKRVSAKCKSNRHYWRDRATLGSWKPGGKSIKAKACVEATKYGSAIDFVKFRLKLNGESAKKWRSKARVRITLAEARYGQWTSWLATVRANNGWSGIGLPEVSCHPLDQCTIQVQATLTNKNTGRERTFSHISSVFKKGASWGVS